MAQLDVSLDRTADVPLGTQLAWRLRAAVASGALRAGDRLPPVRELAATAQVNVNTVRAVYARLAAQGVIVSEQGRGTFVRGGGAGAQAELGELVERVAGDARRHGVDPRELAAVLYARFDEPPRPAGVAIEAARDGHADAASRRALRAEIEALEYELAELEPLSGALESRSTEPAKGARLMSSDELEATRDQLASRVAAHRRERRQAKAVPQAAQLHSASAWPELLAIAPA
jgi:DNA-binding transcriptional regulator YhcF (GntR family)